MDEQHADGGFAREAPHPASAYFLYLSSEWALEARLASTRIVEWLVFGVLLFSIYFAALSPSKEAWTEEDSMVTTIIVGGIFWLVIFERERKKFARKRQRYFLQQFFVLSGWKQTPSAKRFILEASKFHQRG